MNSPLVSVYMPTHNRKAFMVKALRSICEQDYRNLQILVCDDGSSDETWVELQKFAEKDKRIEILKNVNPMGACFSRNRCLDLAKGEFITGLDDDDEFLPNRISTFISYAEQHHSDLLSANLFYKLEKYQLRGEDFEGVITKKDIGYRNIIGNQMFIRTKLMKDIGGFDIDAPAWQDYDLWFRLINEYGNAYRINIPTYIMDVSHDAPRITTSSKAYKGYVYFTRKHESKLSKWQLNSLYLEDKTNRGEVIMLKDILLHPCQYGFSAFVKKSIKKKIPYVEKIIQKKKIKNN